MRLLVAGLLALMCSTPVHGHGEGPGVEVVPARAAAGETVWIFGEDLAPDGPASAALATGTGERRIVEAETDEDGHLATSLVAPADLAPRTYELRVTDAAGLTVSTYLTIIEGSSPIGEAAEPPIALLLAVVGAAGVLVLLALSRARQRR